MAEPSFTFDSRVRPICQIGMSTTRQAEPTSWLDVSCYVHEAELFRGRERFNERFEPGTASVTFSNADGWADLGGTYTEVAAAELRPGRQIRIGVVGPWGGGADITRWLYRGYIDQATPAYDPTLHDVVTVNCIDALGESGSSTAPTGDHQGVNETVSARLNRVLDAVGWWAGKRKIAATATTVQGTELGQRAIDHLGVAADSAGGVVFGDLDGDVVFKDIDWMLYDPDTPPDDGIGNGPGGGGPGAPPYIDPTPGPVYDPDDPPAANPPKVCVCADGTAGTLVEKGDNYRLYVKDGHLFYESSGSTWDMGPYSGGCNCVEPPDGGPPVRTNPDDPDEEFPPPEFLDPVFGVELLNWSDGGLDDPPAAAVTVGGITPGHDCLLVVLATGLGALTDTAGFNPTVTGGGLDWTHRRGADRSGGIASTWVTVTQVGRDDPGTFDVTVTWTPPSTSRSHIVTVWKVVAAVDDYLERFDAGAVAFAVATSTPPEFIQPGDGPVTVDLFATRQPADVPPLTRTVDITIAQTLAEEGTEPFGAVFAELDPPWIIPPNVPPLPEPALFTTGATFSDDFERADGALGANWPAPTDYPAGARPDTTPTIASGAAVTTSGGDAVTYYVTPIPGDHYIEVEIANWHETGTATARRVEIMLLTRWAGPDDFTCAAARWTMAADQDGGLTRTGGFDGGVDGLTSDTFISPADTFRLRLESTVAGHHRLFVDDIVATEFDDTTGTGDYVGFAIYWDFAGTSPQILSAEVGGGATRRTSWTAGWRQGVAAATVDFADVNLGPTDIQSAQAALVLESAATESGWRILDYDLRADVDGTTAAGSFVFDNPPRPGAFLAVFVGVTASSDVMGSVVVGGADFTVARNQPKTGASWGQGAVYTAVAPLDLDDAGWAITITYPACESVSAVVYEVTDQDDVAPVGAVASGVLGTSAAGSVNGPSTITLSATGDAAAVVLAYLHVSTGDDDPSGAATEDGDEWSEELEYAPPTRRGYLHTMSRAPGQPESTSTSVHWDDVQTGTATTFSGVQLAVEIRPNPDPFNPTPGGAGVALGGVNDPFNGIIHSAFATAGGLIVWEFP